MQYSTGNRVLREREIVAQLLRDPPAGVLLEGARTALPSPNLELLTQLEQLEKVGLPPLELEDEAAQIKIKE